LAASATLIQSGGINLFDVIKRKKVLRKKRLSSYVKTIPIASWPML
jgi:hypothetical protein